MIADATERQCHTVWLETVRGAMDPAIAVYRRNGFAESATRPPTLSVDGVIVMERLLSAATRCASSPMCSSQERNQRATDR